MIKIDLVNVQAIGEAHIVLEDNSITEFTGNNSNGKSITSKVIEYLTKGDLVHKDVREALINDYSEQAVILITYNKKQLGLILKRELKDSIIMYVPDIDREKEPNGRIVRPLGDSGACEIIMHEFGFRTYNKGDICLQLAPTFGAIPFVTTSGSVNDDIVNDITTDKVADEFLTSFATITYPLFRDTVKRLKAEKENIQTVLDNMESYDWREYEDIADRMNEVYSAIRSYQFIQIEEIPIPHLDVIAVPEYTVSEIPIIRLYDYCSPVAVIETELENYVSIMNGVCPTCGRPWIEHK